MKAAKKKITKKKVTTRQWYHTNPILRARAMLRSRKAYRQNRGLSLDRSIDLRKIKSFGAVRMVWIGKNELENAHTFTLCDMSNALGISNVSLASWVASGRMPAPWLHPAKGASPLYPLAFVQEAATIMKAHFSKKQYLTAHDKGTISALMAAARSK